MYLYAVTVVRLCYIELKATEDGLSDYIKGGWLVKGRLAVSWLLRMCFI